MLNKILNAIRCTHRHTIEEHPQCFAQGNIIDRRPYAVQIKEPWYTLPGYQVGYLDIEADGLKADFSSMLTWCVKSRGITMYKTDKHGKQIPDGSDGVIYYDMITAQDIRERKGDADERIIQSLADTLSNFAVIVTYYGGDYRYDLPFVRAKALHYNIDFPGWKQCFQYDLYAVVKQKLALSRNSLDAACSYMGIDGKTPILRSAWRDAKYGDEEALKEVLSHNKADVEILEKLHQRLEPFKAWGKTSI